MKFTRSTTTATRVCRLEVILPRRMMLLVFCPWFMLDFDEQPGRV